MQILKLPGSEAHIWYAQLLSRSVGRSFPVQTLCFTTILPYSVVTNRPLFMILQGDNL